MDSEERTLFILENLFEIESQRGSDAESFEDAAHRWRHLLVEEQYFTMRRRNCKLTNAATRGITSSISSEPEVKHCIGIGD